MERDRTAKMLADALDVFPRLHDWRRRFNILDKKTLQQIQDTEKLPDDEQQVIYKVLDSLLLDAKAKRTYT